jgi:hypothetical protein
MSYIASNSKGPTFEYPIVEKNAERCLRPVTIKYRKVLGKRGWMLRRVGHYLGAPKTPEGMAHAALMVGDYVHELHTDEANQKYLVAQRLTGDQIWPSTVGESVQAYTTMTDQEISDTGQFFKVPSSSLLCQRLICSNASPVMDAQPRAWQVRCQAEQLPPLCERVTSPRHSSSCQRNSSCRRQEHVQLKLE